MRDRSSPRAAVILISFALILSAVQVDLPVGASSGPTVANGFNVLTTTWGTSTSPASPGPGSQNVPLTVSLQYYFANTASAIQLSLPLPSGFTDSSGNQAAVAIVTGSVTSGSTVVATFYLNISPAVSVGTYSFPLTINWGVQVSQQQSVALVQYTSVTIYLKGKVQLSFQVQQNSLLAGQVNTLELTISNTGSGTATQIVTAVTAPASVSLLSQIPVLASLAPGSNASSTLEIYVTTSAAGSAISITFTASYTDPYANAATTTQSIGLYASAVAFEEPVLSFSSSTNSLRAGQVNSVTTTLTDLGPGTATAVRATASAPSGVSVLSQFPQVASLQAGESASATLEVFVPTSSAATAVTLTFTVTFDDANGNLQSTTQSLGFYALPAAGPTLTFAAAGGSLAPGKVNEVVVTLTNSGSTSVSQVVTTVSAPSGFSILSQFPVVASLQAGGSSSAMLEVFVPVAAAGSSISLTLSFVFTDSSGFQQSGTQTIGLYAGAVTEPVLTLSATGGPLSPGQVNEITVSLTNNGPGAATAVRVTVSASAGFSVLSQFPQIASLQAGGSANATLQVFAPVSSSGSALTLSFGVTFVDPNGNVQSSTQSSGLYVLSSITISNAISLSVTTTSNSLTSGAGSPVKFVIENTGQVSIYAPTISLSASSPLVVTSNSTVTLAGEELKPGSSVAYTAVVTAGASTTGGLCTGTLTLTFTDQLGNGHSQTFPVAFVVTVPVIQVTASPLSSEISIGKSSSVSFVISNSGTAPVYSPSFALAVPSGLAVVSNSTFFISGLALAPGQRVKYVANVTTGPKTAEGAYVATLTVGYTDQFGNSHSSTFSMGLVAVGAVEMVLQNEKVSGNGTTYSLTGTLLNEGVANAYYTQVTGTVTAGPRQLATSSTYVGEVDVNTPLPVSLSVTIPESSLASANGSATITFTASYQNDYGQALQYKVSQRLSLPSGTSGAGSSGISSLSTSGAAEQTVSASTLDLVRYGALAGIVVAALVTVAYVRRARSHGGKGRLRKPEVY